MVVRMQPDGVHAMVLMAPKIQADETFDLTGTTPAFLGLHWTGDNDPATYGALGPPRRSVFKAYDNAGIVSDDADRLSLTKDFVFFDLNGHDQQNNPGIVAYTTAFLHRHLAGRMVYDRFLKHQEVPSGLAVGDWPVSQQHAEPRRLAVANFETGPLAPALFTNAVEAGIGVLLWPYDTSWLIDDYSPHDTRVLRFDVFDTPSASAVEFPFASPQSLAGYRFLSFRITQVYDDVEMPSGSDRSFDVELCSEDSCWSVDLADYGGVPFPRVVLNLPLDMHGIEDNATKNAMRSILIRLTDFGMPSGTMVNQIRFDFSDGNAANARFIVDDLEFYP